MTLEPIRNERHEIVGYRQELPGGRVDVRNKNGELVGWTAFGQTRKKDRHPRVVAGKRGPTVQGPRLIVCD